jgi:hypothetical protein
MGLFNGAKLQFLKDKTYCRAQNKTKNGLKSSRPFDFGA